MQWSFLPNAQLDSPSQPFFDRETILENQFREPQHRHIDSIERRRCGLILFEEDC
jgi:hypothetical protein